MALQQKLQLFSLYSTGFWRFISKAQAAETTMKTKMGELQSLMAATTTMFKDMENSLQKISQH